MRTLLIDCDFDTVEFYKNSMDKENENLADFVSDPLEALSILSESGSKYTRVITEIFLQCKEINGFRILNEARKQGVQERILLTAISHPIKIRNTNATLLLRKPLTRRKINVLVSNSIDHVLDHFKNRNFSKSPEYFARQEVFI